MVIDKFGRQKPGCRAATLAAILFFVLSAHAAAQLVQPAVEDLRKLDQWVQQYMQDNTVPGALVAVASKGKLVHLQTYGWANVELQVPVTDSTVFEIGSISKQFVAAAVLLLVQEHKLDLDDPIGQHLPWLPSEWLGVTVRQLLTHTSGIPDYEEIRSYDVYRFRLTPEQVIGIAHSRPIDFQPGFSWSYSNTGYYLLSLIVERLEVLPLGKLLAVRIFQPLGMLQTRMADPEAIIRHRASGYWINKAGELINRNPTETSSTLGAGGLLTSVYDLVKWDAALYNDQFLSDKSKKTMWTEALLPNGDGTGYALGWNVEPYKGLRKQSHSGQVAGFVAHFSRFPEQEAAIIVFMNRYRVSSNRLSLAVLHTFMPNLGPIPE